MAIDENGSVHELGAQSAFGFPESTAGQRLVRVAGLVPWLMQKRGIPRRVAVGALCEAIQSGAMASLYWLCESDYAEPVEPACMFGWPTRAQAEATQAMKNSLAQQSAYDAYKARGGHDAPPLADAIARGYSVSLDPDSFSEPGAPALRKRMLADWVSPKLNARGKRQAGLDVDSLDDARSVVVRLAITLDKACELWDYGAASVAVAPAVEPPAVAVLATVEPVGGRWPHKKGAAWTDAERDALFLMRHRDGRTGEELANIAGVKRQMIDEVIGPQNPPGGLSSIEAKSKEWRPSAALLKQCGAALPPLQSAAATLAA